MSRDAFQLGRRRSRVLVVLALVPWLSVDIPYVFPARSNTPGTLQLLALCLVFGGVAMTYDLLFGYTGLLSFGHALYFAVGVYIVAIAITKWHWGFSPAIAFTAVVGLVLPLVLGAVSLRVGGIAFAMVTLAFAQAGSILVVQEPARVDRRRGGPRRGLHEAAGRRSSGSSTRRTSTGSRSATPRSSSWSCDGR